MTDLQINVVLVALALLALVALFFFNGLESALVTLGRLRLRRPEPGPAGSSTFEHDLFAFPMRFLGFTVLGSAVSLAGAIACARALSYAWMEDRPFLKLAVTVLAVAPPLFVFGEALPRALFRRHAEQMMRSLLFPLKVAYGPLYWLGRRIVPNLAAGVGWLASLPGALLDMRATREELQVLMAEGGQPGLVATAGRKMIAQVLEVREQTVALIMQPMAKVVSCPETAGPEMLVTTVVQSGFTRIPVWRDSPGRIAGIIHATDLLESPSAGAGETADRPVEASLQALLRQPLRVPIGTTLIEMLRSFQSSRGHMAIVESADGEALGLLTLEDILERVIGEIRDEHDPKEAGIRQLFQDTFLVDAVLDLATVNRRLGLGLPTGEYGTLSGFLLWLFRKIPAIGEEKSFGDVLFFVTKADGKRVEQAIVKKLKRP